MKITMKSKHCLKGNTSYTDSQVNTASGENLHFAELSWHETAKWKQRGSFLSSSLDRLSTSYIQDNKLCENLGFLLKIRVRAFSSTLSSLRSALVFSKGQAQIPSLLY